MMSTSMFVIGFIIFSVYMTCLFYMIYKSHKSQERDENNDPEIDASNKS